MAVLTQFQFFICTALAYLLSAGASAAPDADCYADDALNLLSHNKCIYKMTAWEGLSQPAASSLCAERGGRLPSVDSEGLAVALGGILKPANVTAVWADGECDRGGGSDDAKHWHYADGRQIERGAWDKRQPTGGDDKECVILAQNESHHVFLLRDAHCDKRIDGELVLCARDHNHASRTATTTSATAAPADTSHTAEPQAPTGGHEQTSTAILTADAHVVHWTTLAERIVTTTEGGIEEIETTEIEKPQTKIPASRTNPIVTKNEPITNETTTQPAPPTTSTLKSNAHGPVVSVMLMVIMYAVAAGARFYPM